MDDIYDIYKREFYRFHDPDSSPFWHWVPQCASTTEKLLYAHLEIRRPYDMDIRPQVKVPRAPRLDAIVDFIISLVNPDTWVIRPPIAIECDGPDHKPAEDKRRDRDLLSLLGIQTIRFTNQEINDSPEECAEEILKIFDQRKGELIKAAFPEELIDPIWMK